MMPPSSTSSPTQPRFFDLPLNMRQQIYRETFSGNICGNLAKFSTPSSTTILRTCKQIHLEALPEFYSARIFWPNCDACDIGLNLHPYAAFLRRNVTSIGILSCSENALARFTGTLLQVPNLCNLYMRFGTVEQYLDITFNKYGEIDIEYCPVGQPVQLWFHWTTEKGPVVFSAKVMPFVETIRQHVKKEERT